MIEHCRKTLHSRTKENRLVIQIQKAFWRKVRPLFSRNKKLYASKEVKTKNIRASESKSCQPEIKTTVNWYVCHDLSVWNKRLKSHLGILWKVDAWEACKRRHESGRWGRERRAYNDLSWIFLSTPETPGHCKAWKLSPQLCHRLEKWQPPETQSDLSSACNILLAIHHFHSYSFARITSNETVCFEGWNKFSVRIWYPENQIWHTDNSYVSHRRRKRFSSSAGLLFGVSSAITDRTRDLAIRASCFYVSVKIRGRLGLLSINFDFRNVIFQPVVFPFVWAKYKWKFMRDRCKLSLPWCHAWRGLFCSPK